VLLNLIVAVIVGFIILILWVLKGVFDCISTMDRTIKKLAKVSDLLHDRLSRLEIIRWPNLSRLKIRNYEI
jgi:hypothetical protein